MIELGKLVLGFLMGYLIVTVTESFFHQFVLHAPRKTIKFWEKCGRVGRYLYDAWFSHHMIHHCKTFKKNHVSQFTCEEERRLLNKDLLELSKSQIISNSYGLRVGGLSQKIKYLYAHSLQLLLLCYLGDIWFGFGVILVAVLYVFIAEYVHPYTHLSCQESLHQATFLMRYFVRSRYFQYLTQHHFVHHKYINCNFNLLLGGDYLLKCHRKPTELDVLEMHEMGLLPNENN